jgi:omega-amidase
MVRQAKAKQSEQAWSLGGKAGGLEAAGRALFSFRSRKSHSHLNVSLNRQGLPTSRITMNLTLQPPRIAIAQVFMHWTIEDNLASMLEAMVTAHAQDARILVFPELAVTGFHRHIAALAQPELTAAATAKVQAACALRSMAIAFGTPTFGDGGERFNSYQFIGPTGALVATIEKVGLTPAEATFFQAGRHRPVATLFDRRCSAVVCPEIEDHDAICTQLPSGSADLLFWPGLMRPDPDKPPIDPPEHVTQAQRLAKSIGAYIVQANWPNALNRPEESEHTGRSAPLVVPAAGLPVA